MSLSISTGTLGISIGLGDLGAWAASLQPASWRGVPFRVREDEVKHGRRTAVHAYPFRNQIFVEDLGLGERQFSFRAFLVGDDVFDQAATLDDAVDTPQSGTLVHPSIGSLTCSLVSFTRRASAENGRVVECELTFLEQGTQLFPSSADDTGSQVDDSASAADQASGADFGSDVAGPIGQAAQQVSDFALATQGAISGAIDTISGTIGEFADMATPFVADAGMIAGAARGLVPPAGVWFGRYGAGALGLSLSPSATVASVLGAGIAAATAVTDAASNAVELAQSL